MILKLIEDGKMRIVINSLSNGSVIASFSIVLDGGENLTKTEISDAFTEALNMSTVLKADLKRTVIEGMNSYINLVVYLSLMVESSEMGFKWHKAIASSILFISFFSAHLKYFSFSILFNHAAARNSCQPGFNDCSRNATCTAEGATYSCQCSEGFTDNSPQVPGRVCRLKQNPPSRNCFMSLNCFMSVSFKNLHIASEFLFYRTDNYSPSRRCNG